MKNRFSFLSLSLLFLLACNLLSQPTAAPTLVPTDTSVPPTETVPAPEPSPTVAPLFFRDDFNEVLAEGWTWQNETPSHWNLTAERGWLELTVLGGHIPSGDYSNLLLRLAPSGNFRLETRLRFEPVANFQFAGLIVYQSDVDFLMAGRAYCERSDLCVGDGLYFDNYINSNFVGDNLATPYTQGAEVSLRLERLNDTYTFFASADGSNWTEIGAQRNALNPLLVGLTTGQNESGPVMAQFDYFQITGSP